MLSRSPSAHSRMAPRLFAVLLAAAALALAFAARSLDRVHDEPMLAPTLADRKIFKVQRPVSISS